jgi:hypothetical protein
VAKPLQLLANCEGNKGPPRAAELRKMLRIIPNFSKFHSVVSEKKYSATRTEVEQKDGHDFQDAYLFTALGLFVRPALPMIQGRRY